MTFNVDETVQEIISIIENNNEEAYVVGGCIRDIIMNKMPKDWDITTSALPSQTIDFFKKTSFIWIFGSLPRKREALQKIEPECFALSTS